MLNLINVNKKGVRDDEDQWYRSFRRYCDTLADTDILAGANIDLAKQDPQYAKWIWILEGKEFRIIIQFNRVK